jgi:putative hydrolase of the HAD superfamily
MESKKLLIFDLDDTLYARYGVVADDYSGMENIAPYSGVIELLNDQEFSKILVTKGETHIQNKKIDLLAIRQFFSRIFICKTDLKKKDIFKSIISQNPESEIIVVGDRIDTEIRYGNELNLKTVRIKLGKYKNLQPKEETEIPQYTINKFSQLKKYLK